MTFPRLASSFIAVALFLGPVAAQEQATPAEEGVVVEQTKAILPPAVKAMLLDTRPLEQMTDAEVQKRLALASKFQSLQGLNDDVRIALEAASASAQEELARRGSAAANGGQDAPADAVLPIGTQIPDDVLAYVKQPANAAELSDADLKARIRAGNEMLNREGWPSDIIKALKGQVSSYRRELVVRQTVASQNNTAESLPGEAEQVGTKKPAAPEITSGDDVKALKVINDKRSARTMALQELRERVKVARRLMKSQKISALVKEQLYKKLTSDRNQLRSRMAAADGLNAGDDLLLPEAKPAPEAPKEVLSDMRPAEDLDDDELRGRIKSFSGAAAGKDVSAPDRANLESRLKADRQILRQRMLVEKRERQAKLKKPGRHIVLNQEPAPFDDITAAEAAEEELEDALVAAPRRKPQRRYTIDEFERYPDLREAVPRIEIDTIRFGFNESFIREEEIESLDRVAYIMERILASNPYEVFLIEGHTDASGSDGYNLGLSRARARAVVEALTTFYVIPPQNLRAIGYGERYLKIPVPYAEAENRRVSVSRVTDFVAFQ